MNVNGNVIRKPKIKTPLEAFPKCPVCNFKPLSVIDRDVFCKVCGWDSMEASVACGCPSIMDGYL